MNIFELKLIVPILIVIGFFIIIKIFEKKGVFSNSTILKVRLLLGGIGTGVFLTNAYYAEKIRDIITLILLSLLMLYGVIRLLKKLNF